MSEAEFNSDILCDLLPLYYSRLFPIKQFYKWLSYGNQIKFAKREISFTLPGDVYIRYQSFDSEDDFRKHLIKKTPIKIDLGAVYQTKPKDRGPISQIKALEKEIVIDIDLSDYDDVRTCCSGGTVCNKCWKFMTIACKILNHSLEEDLGFKYKLWVFSGRRGIHCWICDKEARILNDEFRAVIADFLNLVKGGANQSKKVHLNGDLLHPATNNALLIIDQYFPSIIEEQDLLGTDERLNNFLENINEDFRHIFKNPMKQAGTSSQRWSKFEELFNMKYKSGEIPKSQKNLIEQFKLQYCYPRLDINVTKGLNHLLKSPFSVHPKTGKVSVPFNPKTVDNFSPINVPTIDLLLNQIEIFHQKIKDTDAMDVDEVESITQLTIKDYKKTNLMDAVKVFEAFLKDIEKDNIN